MAKKNAMPDYKTAHKTMKSMTEVELRVAMQAELDKGEQCRPDLLSRLIGRFNRLRGSRCQREVLGLMAYSVRARRNVNAVLDRNS